jgi:hypothetical protein
MLESRNCRCCVGTIDAARPHDSACADEQPQAGDEAAMIHAVLLRSRMDASGKRPAQARAGIELPHFSSV